MTVTVQNRQGRSYVLSALDDKHTVVACGCKQIVVQLSLDEMRALWQRWIFEGVSIQRVFSMLSVDEREFLITAITPQEWDEMFSEEGEP